MDFGSGISVQQTQLATLDSFGILDVTLMKIDVEGSELDVIAGARSTLAHCRPTLWIEIHEDDHLSKLGYPYNRQDIVAALAELGLSYKRSLNPQNHIFGPT
jgi:hypothetical protein